MSCLNFFSFNLANQDATEVTASSEDAFYPASNIKLDHTTKVYRSQVGVNSAWILFDLKTIEPVDSICVVPSSIDGFGYGTITIEANATSNFTSPAFSTSLTPNQIFGFGYITFATQNYRFWRISVTSAGDYVEFSKIFIGRTVTLQNNNIDFGWSFENEDRAVLTANRYDQRYIDRINNQKNINASYKLLNISEVETMLEVWDYHGKSRPIWVVIDDSESIISDAERFAGYFFFKNRPKITNGAFALYDANIQLEEAL